MSRRRSAKRRVIFPDAKYGNLVVAKLINCLMRRGKKSVSEKCVYGAFDLIQARMKLDPLEVFTTAIKNIKPFIEVRSRRVGGATYQVPVEVRQDRALALGLRWLITAAKARKSEKTMTTRLFAELKDAYENKGTAIKKRDDTHKMAEANKAFAHYRW